METDNQTAADSPGPPDPAARGRLVIVGASVRAMAESAARAGYQVNAADLFGDRDLLRIACEAHRAIPYPESLPRLVAEFPPGPWLYTGALENYPQTIEAISRTRPLAGCSAAAVRQIRDPVGLRDLAATAGLSVPDTRLDPVGVPVDGSWLVKPRRSAGGHGIHRWRGWPPEPPPAAPRIWQRSCSGRPWSAAFLITPSGAALIAASRQLIGSPWAGAKPFHWSGGVDVDAGALPPRISEPLNRLGQALATVPGLLGLVGVDLLVHRRRIVTVLEVNPRPTASMELIERGTGISLAQAQLAACGFSPRRAAPLPRPRRQTWSKAILFAPRPLQADGRAQIAIDTWADRWSDQDGWPALADLPLAPQTIPAGRPVCTVFAAGPSAVAAIRLLHRRVQTLRQALFA